MSQSYDFYHTLRVTFSQHTHLPACLKTTHADIQLIFPDITGCFCRIATKPHSKTARPLNSRRFSQGPTRVEIFPIMVH